METNISDIRRRQRKRGLNSLPDEILVDILSLLPLNHAVKTVVLSQRWRYLWTHINAVNIDLQSSHLNNIPKYSEILNKVILKLTSPTIRKFQVIGNRIEKSTEKLFHDHWLDLIYDRNVEEIMLQVKDLNLAIPQLPTRLFKMESLASLELSTGKFLINLPQNGDSINLPYLRKLIVQDVHTSEYGVTEKFIKSCPSLEDLSLISCTLHSHPVSICGMNKKRLLIGLKRSSFYGKFIIDTPNLESLNVNSYFGIRLDSNDMALLEAHTTNPVDAGWYLMSGHYVANSMVTSFEIETYSPVTPLVELPYLTRLHLFDYRNFSTKRFLQTLHHCPVLEILVCHFKDFTRIEEDDDVNGNSTETIVPECLSSHIKKIEINTLYIHHRIFKLIEFLLCKARVLELLIFRRNNKVWLGTNEQYDEEHEFCKKIHGCQKEFDTMPN